jgi:hypothetical protein
MEPEGSLPCSQEPANSPYSEPQISCPNLPDPILFLEAQFHFLSYHLRLGLTSGSFPLVSATNIVYTLLLSPYVTNAPSSHSSWCATRIIFGEQQKSECSSVWNILHSFFTASPLGQIRLRPKQWEQDINHCAVSWKFRIKLLNQ